MAIQYYMRAYNTNLLQFVDWIVNDTPDSTGAFSGYSTGDLTNITVNRIVQSKIENFLQPDQGLIPGTVSSDGYFLHLNSFDWLHAAVPGSPTVISPPINYVGLAVTRGGTTDSQGVLSPGASTNFFACILWDEVAQRWKFIKNTFGDHTTLDGYLPISAADISASGNIIIDGYLAVGTDPADDGIIRIPNNRYILSEINPTSPSTDGYLIGLDTLNRIKLGNLTTDIVYLPGRIQVDGYIRDGSANPSLSGFIRNGNNTTIITARDSGNANDLNLFATNSSNQLLIGNAVSTFSNIFYNTSTNAVHQFQTNTISLLEIGATGDTTINNPNNFARFAPAIVAPHIYQARAASGTGQTFNIQAQSTAAAATGGILQITSGSALTGGFGGTVDLRTGNAGVFPVASTLKLRIHPTTAPSAADNNSVQFFENRIRIDSAQLTPRYMQDDVNISSTPGQTFTVQAQNAIGTTSPGGNLNLTSGTGTTVAGDVFIQTGGVNRVQVTPVQTAIFGNLLVGGTVTSIASTVIELADRVIHVNSSANVFPASVATPSLITGISVDRGTTGGSKRDYHGLFWHEVDGYWKFSVNNDGYTTESSLTTNLPVVAQYMHMQPSATITVAAVPTVGSYRALNNVVHSAARNVAGSQDLILVSTDAADKLIWGAATNNTGHIFRTTTGTIYDFRVADVSTYTLTPQSAGTTTLQATSGVTALVYSQQTTGAASGAPTSLQAQSAATNGGNLILSSGQGSTDANDGYVALETGNNDRIIVRNAFTEFRDNGGESLRVTYVSTGTTQITYAATVTAAQINHTLTAATPSAPMTVQSQVTTASSGVGGNLSLIAGNATGTTSTGGILNLASGSGTTINGVINFQPGGVTQVLITATGQFIQWVSTMTNPTLNQVTTGSGTGTTLTVQAQNAATTGGNLTLTSGTGATVAGDVNLQTGAVSRIIVHPTFTEFRDTAEALRVTPLSAGTTQITYASTVTSSQINQTTTGSATGANMTVQAQNAATTGGNIVVTSGTGATVAGNVQLQTGAVDRVIVRPTFTEFRDTAEALRITPVSAGTTQITYASTATAAQINQTTTGGASGAVMTVQAQNALTTGGDLSLTSGTGGTTTASVVTNKFVFNRGWRRNITTISSAGGTYATLATDDIVAITTLAVSFTINLPATPTVGDTYTVKDATGNAGSFPVTVSGNGNNIDGAVSLLLSQPYASATFTFLNGQWSAT